MIENLSRDRQKNSRRLFAKILSEELTQSLGDIPKLEGIILHLLRCNIIRQSVINRYVVIKIYPEYFKRFEKKQRAVEELTKILPIEQTGVYHILSNHSQYFFPNNFDF
jgi:hypothetical protein